MNSLTSRDQGESRRLVEAAAWRAHLHEADTESSAEFEAWLAQDARNEAAWRQLSAPWDFLGEQATAPELIEARRAALGRAQQVGRRRWRPALRAHTFGYSAAAAVVLAVASGLLWWNANRADVYETAAGERRVVTLSDGSQVALDSQSIVKVRYTDGARDLVLAQGQARFDVAHDVERPFAVVAAEQKIVATGTAFNVDLMERNVLVTLIEGRVVVLDQRRESSASGAASAGGPAAGTPKWHERPIELSAGQQLVISPMAAPSIATVNVERATAWENGQLVFEDEPLASVITRINRYSRQPLILADDDTAKLRISGVFNTGDIDGFVSTLTHYLPVVADEVDGSIRISHR